MSTKRPRSLTQVLIAAGCAVVLAACSDSAAPATFSADGTTADMDAVASAFASPGMASLSWAAPAIDGVFGAPMVGSSLKSILDAAPESGNLAASARRIVASARGFNGGGASGIALAVLPVEALGKTFEYNPTSSAYEPTARTGAPANGVRFILYSINPVTGIPVQPLTEAGYADVLDESTASANAVRLQLVSGGVTYLDYGVSGSSTATTGHVLVDGFARNASNQVNFNLDNSYSDANNGSATLDYHLDVPNRQVVLDYVADLTQLLGATQTHLDVSLSGPHGDVNVLGDLVQGAGELVASVNGEAFAVVTLNGNSQVTSILHPDGSPLTIAEYGALAAIWGAVLTGVDAFEDLLDPLDNLL